MVWNGLVRILLIALLIGLPLLGAGLTGQPLDTYWEFPPVPQPRDTAPFSWPLFAAIVMLITIAVGPLIIRVITAAAAVGYRAYTRPFPSWGWLGVGILALAWILAWSRFPWFAPLQPYTFTPLWIGYILVVNALTLRRTGQCLLVNRTGYFLALFPLSAIFWWFFEYLNLFVGNWYYAGDADLSAMAYFLSSTLPFSTVLPAMLSTRHYLASFPRLSAGLHAFWRVSVPYPELLPWAALLGGAAGLVGMAIWPDYLFPLLWVAPLLMIVALQALSGQDTVFCGLRQGDWRPLWLPALAGLVCGFFWEIWNYYSFARWEYTVPQVHGFQLFAMPLLGYAGYLPFGLICVATADFFLPCPPVTGQPMNKLTG